MPILYHLTVLPPKMPAAEAMSQEISALQSHFGGDLIYLNPNQHSPVYIPRLLFGFHKLKELRAKEASVQLHQLYNPDPFPFAILRVLRRPVVYTLSCGVGTRRPNVAFFNSLAAVTVSDERSFKRLSSWGLHNVIQVRPGIDTSRFTCAPLAPGSEIRLMVGSSPWSPGQFRTKGVDALLAAAQQSSQLHLVFLWRGVFFEEMEQRVRRMGLEKQVTVLNGWVDVNQVLAGVHASVTLVTDPTIVRAYPHSLMESLAAGKPILTSRALPMTDYVEQVGCGKIVETVDPDGILAAVEALVRDYKELCTVAQQLGRRDFAQEAMITSFQRVYDHVLGLAT